MQNIYKYLFGIIGFIGLGSAIASIGFMNAPNSNSFSTEAENQFSHEQHSVKQQKLSLKKRRLENALTTVENQIKEAEEKKNINTQNWLISQKNLILLELDKINKKLGALEYKHRPIL